MSHYEELAAAIGQTIPRNGKKCVRCGDPILKRDTEATWKFNARKYCTRQCSFKAHSEKSAEERAIFVEEVEFLLSCGQPLEEIAAKLGKSVGTAARLLYRSGRPDIAAPFERLRWSVERSNCEVCGATISRTSRRCQTCGIRGWRSAA